MIFSDDIKNRLVCMLDYLMARSAEFGGIAVSMQAIEVNGRMMYTVQIGTLGDSAEILLDSNDNERWLQIRNGKESEWRKV